MENGGHEGPRLKTPTLCPIDQLDVRTYMLDTLLLEKDLVSSAEWESRSGSQAYKIPATSGEWAGLILHYYNDSNSLLLQGKSAAQAHELLLCFMATAPPTSPDPWINGPPP